MKYTILASIIALVMVASVSADPDLVLYFSFDNFGDVVPDESGKGNDGMIMGSVVMDADGNRGGAASFADEGYIDLEGANFPASDIPVEAMTLCAWAKVEDTGGHHAIFNARANDETWVIHPELRSDGGFRWLLRAAGGNTIFDIRAGSWTPGEWVHFGGVYSSTDSMATLYVNGVEAGTEDARIPNAQIVSDWGMGARVGKNIDDARPFTGLMDDLCIYKRALTVDEIAEVMAGGPPSAAPVSPESSLAVTWGSIK
ncbi:hypothetical protein GF312_21135 [Candidatus Poribacteria bacterium]|nr:hypothetical protein [Candidatus Poribacteria bacterium]